MSFDLKSDKREAPRKFIQNVEFVLNVVNQMCIGFVTIYMSWLCFRLGLTGTMHAWLTTIGVSITNTIGSDHKG